MPQIIFGDDERAEIERLVAKHSLSNHPLVAPTLQLVRQDARDEFVHEYESALRTVVETGYAVLGVLENAIAKANDVSREELLDGLRDMLLMVDNLCLGGRSSEEMLLILSGQGDSKVSEACFILSSDLVAEFLATNVAPVPVTS